MEKEFNLSEKKISEIEQIFIDYDEAPECNENDESALRQIREVLRR